jgi:DNA replication protein DnaC
LSYPHLSFKQWGTVFPGAACVAALIDRFVQHCFVMDIDGESYRKKEARLFAEAQKAKKTNPNDKKKKS